MSQRYHVTSGESPAVEYNLITAGPQTADQVPEEVQALLNKPGVYRVVVLLNHGEGNRIETFAKFKEPSNPVEKVAQVVEEKSNNM